jgi:thimet oligopeptidase
MKYSAKHIVILCSLAMLAGCNWFSKSDAQTDKKEPAYIMKNVQDVVKLFSKTAEEITQIGDDAIATTEKNIQEIIKIETSARTFKNTARALDETGVQLFISSCRSEILDMVHPSKDIREAAHAACAKIRSFAVDAFLNVDLYNAFKSYVEGNAKKEKLNAEELFFLEEEMRGFKRSGLHLPAEQLEKVKALKKEITKLSLSFNSNIAQDKSSITVPREDLAGMEDHFIDALEKDDDGNFVLKCDYPTIQPIFKHCKKEKTRHDLFIVYQNRAYPKNESILETIIAKRDELAKLLGFDSYAAFEYDNEMVKTTERVDGFISDLVEKSSVKEQKEFDQLVSDLPEGVTLVDGKMNPWNLAFAKEYYKQKHFNVDDRKITEYFPMEKTIQGVFDIYQKFFGLQFKETKPDGLWHKDVSVIEIHEKKNGNLQGYILLDLYPRDNKYSHACHATIIPAQKNDIKGTVPSVAVLVANFPKSTKERPSLLKHSDVETFFHEFGHAMHSLLGQTEMAGFSGTDTKTDFVEMPSQMLEEWMWDKEMLKMVSSHFKTGEPLPDALIDKMIELKKFDSGYFVQRQLWLARTSYECFLEGENKNVKDIMRSIHDRYCTNIRFEPKTNYHTSFGHLSGYGAKYYGYMWSKVFALDLFETIKKQGLLNFEIGEKLANNVLGKGGSVDPNKLLRDFLGREPNQDAFLRDLGL